MKVLAYGSYVGSHGWTKDLVLHHACSLACRVQVPVGS
jgi:hypothetical protein